MASRIQGITVEIGGDTTKLSKALEGVNKTIKGTQSSLKDVNKTMRGFSSLAKGSASHHPCGKCQRCVQQAGCGSGWSVRTGRSRGVVLDTLLGLFMSFPMCSPATGARTGSGKRNLLQHLGRCEVCILYDSYRIKECTGCVQISV